MPRISSLESRARYSLHVRGRGGGHYFQILTLPSSHFGTVRVGGRRGVDTSYHYAFQLNEVLSASVRRSF